MDRRVSRCHNKDTHTHARVDGKNLRFVMARQLSPHKKRKKPKKPCCPRRSVHPSIHQPINPSTFPTVATHTHTQNNSCAVTPTGTATDQKYRLGEIVVTTIILFHSTTRTTFNNNSHACLDHSLVHTVGHNAIVVLPDGCRWLHGRHFVWGILGTRP